MNLWVNGGWKRRIFMRSLIPHRMFARLLGYDVQVDKITRADGTVLDSIDPRANTLELVAREIYRYNIDGSTAEVGVFQGDFAKLINHYFPDRKLYLFDTFEGFDERDAEVDRKENFSSAKQDFSNTSTNLVLSKMEHKENCIVRKGWFPQTAEGIDDKFCFVSLDTDLYQPIFSGLEFFYSRLVHGGMIMVHDFNNNSYNGVRPAVKEFCDKNNIGYMCLSDYWGSVVITK